MVNDPLYEVLSRIAGSNVLEEDAPDSLFAPPLFAAPAVREQQKQSPATPAAGTDTSFEALLERIEKGDFRKEDTDQGDTLPRGLIWQPDPIRDAKEAAETEKAARIEGLTDPAQQRSFLGLGKVPRAIDSVVWDLIKTVGTLGMKGESIKILDEVGTNLAWLTGNLLAEGLPFVGSTVVDFGKYIFGTGLMEDLANNTINQMAKPIDRVPEWQNLTKMYKTALEPRMEKVAQEVNDFMEKNMGKYPAEFTATGETYDLHPTSQGIIKALFALPELVMQLEEQIATGLYKLGFSPELSAAFGVGVGLFTMVKVIPAGIKLGAKTGLKVNQRVKVNNMYREMDRAVKDKNLAEVAKQLDKFKELAGEESVLTRIAELRKQAKEHLRKPETIEQLRGEDPSSFDLHAEAAELANKLETEFVPKEDYHLQQIDRAIDEALKKAQKEDLATKVAEEAASTDQNIQPGTALPEGEIDLGTPIVEVTLGPKTIGQGGVEGGKPWANKKNAKKSPYYKKHPHPENLDVVVDATFTGKHNKDAPHVIIDKTEVAPKGPEPVVPETPAPLASEKQPTKEPKQTAKVVEVSEKEPVIPKTDAEIKAANQLAENKARLLMEYHEINQSNLMTPGRKANLEAAIADIEKQQIEQGFISFEDTHFYKGEKTVSDVTDPAAKKAATDRELREQGVNDPPEGFGGPPSGNPVVDIAATEINRSFFVERGRQLTFEEYDYVVEGMRDIVKRYDPGPLMDKKVNDLRKYVIENIEEAVPPFKQAPNPPPDMETGAKLAAELRRLGEPIPQELLDLEQQWINREPVVEPPKAPTAREGKKAALERIKEAIRKADAESLELGGTPLSKRDINSMARAQYAEALKKPASVGDVLNAGDNFTASQLPELGWKKPSGIPEKAVYYDPREFALGTRTYDELTLAVNEEFARLQRKGLTPEAARASKEITDIELTRARVAAMGDKYGKTASDRLTTLGDEVRIGMMRKALQENRPFYEGSFVGNKLVAREITPDAIRGILELNKGDISNVSNATVNEKLAVAKYNREKGLKVSEDTLVKAIEEERADLIAEIVADQSGDQAASIIEAEIPKYEDGPSNPIHVVKDLYDTYVDPWLGGQEGSVYFDPIKMFGPEQRLRLKRMHAHAVKTGQHIVDMMRRAGGFTEAQLSLYRQYLDSQGPTPDPTIFIKPGGIPADATAIAAGDLAIDMPLARTLYSKEQAVKVSAKGDKIWSMPRNWSDIKAFWNAKELPSNLKFQWLQKFVTNVRMLEQANLAQPIQYAYRAVTQELRHAQRLFTSEANGVFKGLSRVDKQNIAANGYARTKEGQAINAYNGITPDALTTKQQVAMDYIDMMNAEMFKQVNETRTAIGLEPILAIDNYFTHARVFNWLERLQHTDNMNMGRSNANLMHKQYISHIATTFQHEKTRLGGMYSAEYNAQKLFMDYHRRALNHIHTSPFTAKIHELISRVMPDPKTGQYTWNLSQQKPQLHKALLAWNNHLTGKVDVATQMGPYVNRLMARANQNLVYSLLSWNYRSAGIQPTALISTYTEIGAVNTIHGLKGILEDVIGYKGSRFDINLSNREFAKMHSKILEFRNADIMLEEMGGRLQAFAESLQANMSGVGDAAFQYRGLASRMRSKADARAAAAAKKGATPESITEAGRQQRNRNIGQVTGPGLDVAYSSAKVLGDAGLTLLKFLDMESAIATWNGAFRRAVTKTKNHTPLNWRDAANYADDVVTRTQGSSLPGDISPIQRTQVGKFFTLFQTYAINEWGFLMRDVLGRKSTHVDPTSLKAGDWKKLVRHIGGTILANYIMESEFNPIPLNTPRPRPFNDFIEGFAEGGPMAGTVAMMAGLGDLVPFVGQATKYGEVPGPPYMGAIVNLLNAFQNKPFAQGIPRTLATVAGVPGVSQYAKYKNATARGDRWWKALGGFYEVEGQGGADNPAGWGGGSGPGWGSEGGGSGSGWGTGY